MRLEALAAPTFRMLSHFASPPATLGALRALEVEAFPECERLGAAFESVALQRTNGLLVAEVGDALAGYLLYARTASSGIITKVAVSSEYRRQGIGSALLHHGVRQLAAHSRRAPLEVFLHVDPSRFGALRLYENNGFEPYQRISRYYDDKRDAILMRRIIGDPKSESGEASARSV